MGGDRKGENRVLRGGSWINNGRNCRSAYRNMNDPGNRNDNAGLRLVRAQQGQKAFLTRSPSRPYTNGDPLLCAAKRKRLSGMLVARAEVLSDAFRNSQLLDPERLW